MGKIIAFPSHKISPSKENDSMGEVLNFKTRDTGNLTLNGDIDASVFRHPAKGNAPIGNIVTKLENVFTPNFLILNELINDQVTMTEDSPLELADTAYELARLDAVLQSLKTKISPKDLSQLVTAVKSSVKATASDMYAWGAEDGYDHA